jgi:hypothetical protein
MSNDSQTAKEKKTSIAPMLSVRNGVRAIEFFHPARARLGFRGCFALPIGEIVARSEGLLPPKPSRDQGQTQH